MKTTAMSDIGKALASPKEGEFYLKKMNELLDIELGKVDVKVRKGLDKAEYEEAQQQKLALHSAKLAIKSIHLFHHAA